MPTTIHTDVPKDDWISLSDFAGLNGRVSNSGNATLIYQQGPTKPAASSTQGFRIDDDRVLDYAILAPDHIWMRALHSDGIASVTPGEAVEVSNGSLNVISGFGDLTRDARGIQKYVQDFSLFHSVFTFAVHPAQWIIYENEIETPNAVSTKGVSVDGILKVNSGATALDSCWVESRRHPRYQPDRGVKWAASVGFKTPNNDGVLKAGLLVNHENGVYFKTKGDGQLYAVIFNDGAETHEELIDFTNDFPDMGIDITLGNLYDIQLQWRGIGFARFFVEHPVTGFSTLVKEINFLNTFDESVFVRNPAMSVGFHAENVTENVSMWVGCVDITSEGGRLDREQYGEHSNVRTVTAGGTNCVTALRNPNLAPNGRINTRDLNLARIVMRAAGKCTIKMYRTRDATAVVGGTWNPTRTGSFVEANDTVTSVNLAAMEEFATFRLEAGEKDSRDNPSKDTIDFFGIHGDYLVAVITSGNNIEVTVTIEWGEEV